MLPLINLEIIQTDYIPGKDQMATGKHYLLKIIIYLYLERGLRITIEVYMLYIFLLALWHEISAEEDRNDPYYICKGNNAINTVSIHRNNIFMYLLLNYI